MSAHNPICCLSLGLFCWNYCSHLRKNLGFCSGRTKIGSDQHSQTNTLVQLGTILLGLFTHLRKNFGFSSWGTKTGTPERLHGKLPVVLVLFTVAGESDICGEKKTSGVKTIGDL